MFRRFDGKLPVPKAAGGALVGLQVGADGQVETGCREGAERVWQGAGEGGIHRRYAANHAAGVDPSTPTSSWSRGGWRRAAASTTTTIFKMFLMMRFCRPARRGVVLDRDSTRGSHAFKLRPCVHRSTWKSNPACAGGVSKAKSTVVWVEIRCKREDEPVRQPGLRGQMLMEGGRGPDDGLARKEADRLPRQGADTLRRQASCAPFPARSANCREKPPSKKPCSGRVGFSFSKIRTVLYP